jgi:hypothetical protein
MAETNIVGSEEAERNARRVRRFRGGRGPFSAGMLVMSKEWRWRGRQRWSSMKLVVDTRAAVGNEGKYGDAM